MAYIYTCILSLIRPLHTRSGYGLVETIIVVAVIGGILGTFFGIEQLGIRLLRQEKEHLEAFLLAEEGMEAVRALRDTSWTTHIAPLATNGTPYYAVIENARWKLTTTAPPLLEGIYTRTILFASVNRDGADRIAGAGALDPGTRKVTVRINWGASQKELITYITDFRSLLPAQTENIVLEYTGGTTDANLANFPSDTGDGDPGQTITIPVTPQEITKIELQMRRATPAPSNLYLEVREVGGPVLASSTIVTVQSISDITPEWTVFRFPDPVPVHASSAYLLRLRSIPSSTNAGSGAAGTLHWIYHASGSYTGGNAKRYIEQLGNPLTEENLPAHDLNFRIYALQ
ncbi:MAG: hypothetical protein G01um101466_29 [Parcubacteria group bacterium Gr01-1014_66]|nr:MAG: hypothetical protein G01um101466_29 [Parcubacteria group bacterium Gr01-1014_66]